MPGDADLSTDVVATTPVDPADRELPLPAVSRHAADPSGASVEADPPSPAPDGPVDDAPPARPGVGVSPSEPVNEALGADRVLPSPPTTPSPLPLALSRWAEASPLSGEGPGPETSFGSVTAWASEPPNAASLQAGLDPGPEGTSPAVADEALFAVPPDRPDPGPAVAPTAGMPLAATVPTGPRPSQAVVARVAATAPGPSAPGSTLAAVQRSTAPELAVRPDPPHSLQRFPGLDTLAAVRDRPVVPAGLTALPVAPAPPPDGIPGVLPSVPSSPAALPPAPGAPGVSEALGGRPGIPTPPVPMPVATTRALVAALAAATTAEPAAPEPGDGRSAPVPAPAPPADAGTTAGTPVAPDTTPAATASAAGPPPGAQSPQELDELARRLYDPLASRLRADLLLDRERRGRRTDAW